MHVDAAAIRRLLLKAPLILRGAISKHLTALEQSHQSVLEARLREADAANRRAKAAEDTAAALRCELNEAHRELARLRAVVKGAAELLASSVEVVPQSSAAAGSSTHSNH